MVATMLGADVGGALALKLGITDGDTVGFGEATVLLGKTDGLKEGDAVGVELELALGSAEGAALEIAAEGASDVKGEALDTIEVGCTLGSWEGDGVTAPTLGRTEG